MAEKSFSGCGLWISIWRSFRHLTLIVIHEIRNLEILLLESFELEICSLLHFNLQYNVASRDIAKPKRLKKMKLKNTKRVFFVLLNNLKYFQTF
jgi:hypothetical protein